MCNYDSSCEATVADILNYSQIENERATENISKSFHRHFGPFAC